MIEEINLDEPTQQPVEAPPADIENVLASLRTTIGNLAQENAVLRAQLIQVLTSKE